MAEYIDREALLDKLEERDLCLCVTEWDIKEMPAVDVAPVVHGKWVKTDDGVCYWYECSMCHECTPFGRYKEEWFSNYCPNCGAYMREDNNGQE